jgi:hypothetical protein
MGPKMVDEVLGSVVGGIWERRDQQTASQTPEEEGRKQAAEQNELTTMQSSKTNVDLLDDDDDVDGMVDTTYWHTLDDHEIRPIHVGDPKNPYEGTEEEDTFTSELPDMNQCVVAIAPFGGGFYSLQIF